MKRLIETTKWIEIRGARLMARVIRLDPWARIHELDRLARKGLLP